MVLVNITKPLFKGLWQNCAYMYDNFWFAMEKFKQMYHVDQRPPGWGSFY